MEFSDLLPDISIFKKSITTEEQISSTEAYNLWNALRARYISIETYKLYRNFVHDRDFDLLLDGHIEDFQEQITMLENLADKYKVKVPAKPSDQLQTSAHIDIITDKLIFRRIYSDLISELYFLSRSISSTTYNDKLRRYFIDFVENHLNNYENLYKYGKTKGWTDVAPSFKTHQPGEKEQLSAGEAGHIWDHLNLRYDQVQLTRIFLDFVHDTEFKLILEQGNKILQKQAKLLAEKATEYEVPTPEKPPASQKAKIDPEIMEDKFAYRVILKGIQEAIDSHIGAVIETIRNDKLRKLFFDLYNEEVELFNDLIEYGKMKGWTHIIPTYRKA
ncbi:DUF3231 family protein [Acetohalobium arabaticum]|uniref:Uncharacterized protein n=1 Tax=Acetohalobium arabaticum (strain ATCC 49924 / DSM 5501 / Z-7288) TaxID=574087 RepID=D9QRB3_ACEAZ|nr:DUF3231 family protein [Acetohalobium arabaticum]ADL13054.1 conserved hypothetical protein [Acetohalobium arabaticum DSM 5501]